MLQHAMCEYFVKADPVQYDQRSRTVCIRNLLISLRLESLVVCHPG